MFSYPVAFLKGQTEKVGEFLGLESNFVFELLLLILGGGDDSNVSGLDVSGPESLHENLDDDFDLLVVDDACVRGEHFDTLGADETSPVIGVFPGESVDRSPLLVHNAVIDFGCVEVLRGED